MLLFRLCEAYPDAKVIFNGRDADEWLKSMNQTLFQVFKWPSLKILRYTDPRICDVWIQHDKMTWDYISDKEYTNESKIKQ